MRIQVHKKKKKNVSFEKNVSKQLKFLSTYKFWIDPQLFLALYDFQAGGENQLSLKKGLLIKFLTNFQ